MYTTSKSRHLGLAFIFNLLYFQMLGCNPCCLTSRHLPSSSCFRGHDLYFDSAFTKPVATQIDSNQSSRQQQLSSWYSKLVFQILDSKNKAMDASLSKCSLSWQMYFMLDRWLGLSSQHPSLSFLVYTFLHPPRPTFSNHPEKCFPINVGPPIIGNEAPRDTNNVTVTTFKWVSDWTRSRPTWLMSQYQLSTKNPICTQHAKQRDQDLSTSNGQKVEEITSRLGSKFECVHPRPNCRGSIWKNVPWPE